MKGYVVGQVVGIPRSCDCCAAEATGVAAHPSCLPAATHIVEVRAEDYDGLNGMSDWDGRVKVCGFHLGILFPEGARP